MALKQFHEVAVLRHHHDASGTCGSKDVGIFCVPKAEVTDRERIQVEAHPQPHRDGWRQLCIQPENHATTTG